MSFCIEQYKHDKSMDGKAVMDLFDRYGISSYLYTNYDVLHTQNRQWLMEEIDDLIARRKEGSA